MQTTIGKTLSKIEVRRKVIAPKNEISIKRAISYFAHEIGHHMPAIQGRNEEQKAFDVADALEQILQAQMQAPQLLGVDGVYISIVHPTCRDQIHVEADPISGDFSITSTTNTINDIYCGVFHPKHGNNCYEVKRRRSKGFKFITIWFPISLWTKATRKCLEKFLI